MQIKDMYAIKLDGSYVVMNEDNSDYERFTTFEAAEEAELLYSEYDTEIVAI